MRYAGGYHGPGGLYHYGQRRYDPTTGRWTQPDPLDQTGDMRQDNRYAHGGCDPINATDLSGTHYFVQNFGAEALDEVTNVAKGRVRRRQSGRKDS